jgi:hypothetical protein
MYITVRNTESTTINNQKYAIKVIILWEILTPSKKAVANVE